MSELPESALPPEWTELRSKLAQTLSAPFPNTLDERVQLLETHLRESLNTATYLPAARDITPENLAEYVGYVRQTATDVARLVRNSSVLESPCDEAAALGVVLISVGCGISPAAGVLGFGIGVYELVQHCG